MNREELKAFFGQFTYEEKVIIRDLLKDLLQKQEPKHVLEEKEHKKDL